jgi:gas vesicle protein
VLAAVLVGFGIWKYSDLLSSVNAPKQAVIATSDAVRNKIENSSAQAMQEIRNGAGAAKLASGNASSEMARQSAELKKTVAQAKSEMSREATSLRTDVESSRSELQAASKLTPEIEALRNQLAQANREIEAQQKVISSTEEFLERSLALIKQTFSALEQTGQNGPSSEPYGSTRQLTE